MKRSALTVVVSTVLLGSALMGVPAANATTPASYYNDCGAAAVVMPKSITEYCADAGAGVINIKWSTWGATSAKGIGTFYINGCDPNCASGKTYKTSKVAVLLNGATKTHGKNFLMRVTVTPAPGKKFVWPPKMKPLPTKVTWVTDLWRG